MVARFGPTTAMQAMRGDPVKWALSVTDEATGAAVDITGWSPRVTVKPSWAWPDSSDASAAMTATVGSGLTVTSPASGAIALAFTSAQTTALDPGVYVWDLQLTNGQETRTVLIGTLTIAPDVSRTAP